MRTPALVSAALALFSTLVAVAPSALAQTLETVVTHDGSLYQGELVEKVVGDRVVLKLATGEVKTIYWEDVASVRESVPAPPIAPAAPPAPAPAPTPITPPASPLLAGKPDAGHVPMVWSDPRFGVAPPRERPYGQSIDFGVHIGMPQIGSPVGLVGLMLEYKPLSWLGAELSGGYDGPAAISDGDLGWSFAQTARIGNVFGLGIGTSEHFGARGTGVANMGHAELFVDLNLGNLTVRMEPGITGMFNGASHPGACGFPFNMFASGNFDANDNPTDQKCMFVYFDLEVMYRHHFARGDDAS